MAEEVKSTRAYVSPRREQQAASTRRAILESAQRLFESQGYAITTVDAIAADASVSLKTVYLAFGTKARLLRAVWDLALKGDESDTPVADRPWYLELLEEPDPERKLRLVAHNSCVVKMRIAPILRVIRDAAPSDPELHELWELIQSDFYVNQRTIVESLKRTGALASDLDVPGAADVLWTLNHPDVWLLLVGRRGWTPERFETWLGDTACAQLLPPRRSRRSRQ
ncbi:MAG: TetR/AcrR family transcriptional regulator [Thermoleophilaceae bacterium]|nr:TetR/AcrR family transcriptional regulator [Thermoleophilaceae bacterium]